MALRPAYGFRPYGFRLGGLPAGATGYGLGSAESSDPRVRRYYEHMSQGVPADQSRFVVITDRFGDKHAAELGDRESPYRAAKILAEDLGLDAYEAKRFRIVRARDAGAARLMGVGATQLELDYIGNDDAVVELPATPARRRGVSRKPGRIAKCKVVKITMRNGKSQRRKLCWDKHGVLARNTKAGARSGSGAGARKVVCKRKCRNGGRAVCTGGYRKVKGKRVCKKFVCRKRG